MELVITFYEARARNKAEKHNRNLHIAASYGLDYIIMS